MSAVSCCVACCVLCFCFSNAHGAGRNAPQVAAGYQRAVRRGWRRINCRSVRPHALATIAWAGRGLRQMARIRAQTNNRKHDLRFGASTPSPPSGECRAPYARGRPSPGLPRRNRETRKRQLPPMAICGWHASISRRISALNTSVARSASPIHGSWTRAQN